jgi:hypothetical protein
MTRRRVKHHCCIYRRRRAAEFMALLDFAGLLPPNRETPRRFTVAPWRVENG